MAMDSFKGRSFPGRYTGRGKDPQLASPGAGLPSNAMRLQPVEYADYRLPPVSCGAGPLGRFVAIRVFFGERR